MSRLYIFLLHKDAKDMKYKEYDIAELINENVKINWMIRYMKGMIIQSSAILDVSIYLKMGIYQYISWEKYFLRFRDV